MTLQEWAQQSKAYVGHKDGAYWIPITHVNNDNDAWHLFHLNDYVVSSCTGGTYWLVPRPSILDTIPMMS